LKRLGFIFRVMWLLGLIAMVLIGYDLEESVLKIESSNFNHLTPFWFFSVAPAFFGIYLSLLFIKKWSVKINEPLLICVSVPCLILTFYSPVVYTIVSMTTSSTTFSVPIPFWLLKINHSGMISLVGGFSLFMALFGFDRSKG